MIEPLKRGSYGAVKRKIDELVNQLNAWMRVRIVRGDTLTEDSVTVSNSGVLIKLKGMPETVATVGAAGAGVGLLIYRTDDTQEFFAASDILSGYDSETDDNWSLEFSVDSGALEPFATTAPVGTTATDNWELDGGGEQTVYRIPVIRTISGVKRQYDISGIYRENRFSAGAAGGIVELIRIG